MLRVRIVPPLAALLTGTMVLGGSLRAQDSASPGSLTTLPVPIPLDSLRAAVDDPTPLDRSQILLELIRRSYDVPGAGGRQWMVSLEGMNGMRSDATDSVPLPLSPAAWTDAILPKGQQSHHLAFDILNSRPASLMYAALLSLDDGTRAWMEGERDLLREVSAVHAGAFLHAAPAIRVKAGTAIMPGGERAAPVWEAIAGQPLARPAAFVRALLAQNQGRLAYFAGSMAQLPEPRVALSLGLDNGNVSQRIDTARRLFTVFDRLMVDRDVEARVFSRAQFDPALLVNDLEVDADGRPFLPGSQAFWEAVLSDDFRPGSKGEQTESHAGPPVDFAWLCDRIFRGSPVVHRRPYTMVLFASRRLKAAGADANDTAIESVRAAGDYPALTAALERAGIIDLNVYVAAARHAARLDAVSDGERATRALAQYQGALGLVARASARGAITASTASQEIAALSAIRLNDRDEYDGQIITWLTSFVREHAPELPEPSSQDNGAEPAFGARDPSRRVFPGPVGAIDDAALRLLSGPLAAEPEMVVWEGTRYRVDFTSAEVARLAATLGEGARPYLSAAVTLHSAAPLLEKAGSNREQRDAAAALVANVTAAAEWEPDVVRELDRATRESTKSATRASAALRQLADELLARGLMDVAYAPALGYPDRAPITAHEAAERHDFGRRALNANPWWLPTAGTDRSRDWRVTGSLLNLDVKLSEFSLRRLTSKPPARPPTMTSADRHVLTDAMILMQPHRLGDTDRERLVEWIRTGRTRLAAARTASDARTIADAIGIDPVRRSLLAWTVAHDRERLPRALGPGELLVLGRDAGTLDALDMWGVSAEPRLGCVCLRFPSPHASGLFTSRVDSGIFATGFVDLNLRLSELLDDLGMPASMLAPVLESATLDLIERSVNRHRDDRRGWLEVVQGLTIDRVELYLGLLTTDGPLVPIGEQVDRDTGTDRNPRERR